MFQPLRPSSNALHSANDDQSANMAVSLHCQGRRVLVTHDGFTIGSSPNCDLTLAEASVPLLHSVIHVQSGATWIEAADDTILLTVNDTSHRRMSLRHHDRLKIGTSEFQIVMQPELVDVSEEAPMTEDLALLTAEELCDRILAEQSMVTEFAEGQRSGWEALLKAIEAANDEPVAEELGDDLFTPIEEQQVTLDTLLGQIQELNESVSERTRELEVREIEVIQKTTILEESQQQVTKRIDEILDQLNQTDPPGELRASA